MAVRPKILLVALENFGTARPARELQSAGFQVGIVCRGSAFLAKTRFYDERFLFSPKNHGPGLMAALSRVVSAWRPDRVLPMDDLTALFLAGGCRQKNDAALIALLVKSLGNPEGVIAALDKWRAWQAAEETGIRAPVTHMVNQSTEMETFSRQNGFPLVLKRSFGLGGLYVHICRNSMEMETAWNQLQPQNKFPLGRLYDWREKIRARELGHDWLPASYKIIASKFVAGRPAMVQAVALDGRMLGALAGVAEENFPKPVSPASVVRIIRHEEMRRSAEKLIAHWKLSGFIAFDFVLDAENRAWFLECNPRPIAIAHLGALAGEDLCRRFYAAVTGTPPPVEKSFQEISVAHFPLEQRRDPNSQWLHRALHDVPGDDPDLAAALLAEPVNGTKK